MDDPSEELKFKSKIKYVCNSCGRAITQQEIVWIKPYGEYRGYSEVKCPQCGKIVDWYDSTD